MTNKNTKDKLAITLIPGKYGTRALFNRPWDDRMLKLLIENNIQELAIMSDGFRHVGNLNFLTNLPHLKQLSLLDYFIPLKKNIPNIEEIYQLKELKELCNIDTNCNCEIRLNEFPQLESCSIKWRKKVKSLFECKNLKRLEISHYNEKSITEILKLEKLEKLSIVFSQITCLKGIGSLKKLNDLELWYMPKLESFDGLDELTNLKSLSVHSCGAGRIKSILPISKLVNLQKLYLESIGKIDTFVPLQNLINLERLNFPCDTNIIDGNLDFLDKMTWVKDIGFKNRKHYSRRREQYEPAKSECKLDFNNIKPMNIRELIHFEGEQELYFDD